MDCTLTISSMARSGSAHRSLTVTPRRRESERILHALCHWTSTNRRRDEHLLRKTRQRGSDECQRPGSYKLDGPHVRNTAPVDDKPEYDLAGHRAVSLFFVGELR